MLPWGYSGTSLPSASAVNRFAELLRVALDVYSVDVLVCRQHLVHPVPGERVDAVQNADERACNAARAVHIAKPIPQSKA